MDDLDKNNNAQFTLKKTQMQGRTKDLSRGVLISTLRFKSFVLTPQMGLFQRKLTKIMTENLW